MKRKAVVKLAVDAAMTVLLLLLMAFELVGRAAHEWIGVGMFFAFLLHHLLNGGWTKRLFQGKYTPYRILQTVMAALVFLAILGSFASAVFISQEVFAFLPRAWPGAGLSTCCAPTGGTCCCPCTWDSTGG